jgi:hypothetical protein
MKPRPYPAEEIEYFDSRNRTHPRPRRRQRKRTLASVVREARKAALDIARVDVDPASGRIGVVTGKAGNFFDDGESTSRKFDGADASEWN